MTILEKIITYKKKEIENIEELLEEKLKKYLIYKNSMKKLKILLILNLLFLTGCQKLEKVNEIEPLVLEKKDIVIVQDQSSIVHKNFPDYLKIENGKLFCEYGDKNDPKPESGTFYSKEIISEVKDPKSLEIINFQYGKDRFHVYEYGEVCTESIPESCNCFFYKLNLDVNSIDILNDHQIKDKDILIVFSLEKDIEDIMSFQLIKTPKGEISPYGKDKNNIYYYGDNIRMADVNSFEVLDLVNGKDKNNFYEDGVFKSGEYLKEIMKDLHIGDSN